MLGLGRGNVRKLAADGVGRLDLEALAAELERAAGNAIVIANAGEVNAGEFDPIAAIADLVEEHGGWLHVDGAFGLFARAGARVARARRRGRASRLGRGRRPQVAQRPL